MGGMGGMPGMGGMGMPPGMGMQISKNFNQTFPIQIIMVKHRRYSDKPKEDSVKKDEKIKFQELSSEKTSFDLKTILLSGTKYAYIIAAVALLSGIFTPLTLGVEIEDVIF